MTLLFWLGLAWIAWHWWRSQRAGSEDGRSDAFGQSRKALLEGLSGLLAKVAKADGRVSEEEVVVAQRFLRSIGLSHVEYRFCVDCFNAARGDSRDAAHYARLFMAGSSTESRLFVYELLWSVAAADGVVQEGEDALLRRLAILLGLGDGAYGYCRRSFAGDFGGRGPNGSRGRSGTARTQESDLARAYARLGCSPSDSDETVRSAYRRQALKYHPDRLRAEGLPEGMLKKATESMAEINAAWDKVRRARGMN